jgi:dihydrofolate reductase
MQIKGKILTIAGIVVIFGYFIWESFNQPDFSDPNAVIMVGADTLGRDWGAIADQQAAQQAGTAAPTGSLQDAYSTGGNNMYGQGLIQQQDDPYQRDKFNADNYSTIQSADGREIITEYDREEDDEQFERFETRHQKETKEIRLLGQ